MIYYGGTEVMVGYYFPVITEYQDQETITASENKGMEINAMTDRRECLVHLRCQ